MHLSPHLGRAPDEPVDSTLVAFYGTLLETLKRPLFREGTWQLLECTPAWPGNWTHDCMVAYRWLSSDGQQAIVVVNYADHQSQCLVRLPDMVASSRAWRLSDLLSPEVYERRGSELASTGLFIDAAAWKASVFWMEPC